jgi:hypothetical protein
LYLRFNSSGLVCSCANAVIAAGQNPTVAMKTITATLLAHRIEASFQ